ncbi:MAG: DUF1127 domain-containing protein [Pseudomonadota bacterium]
MLAVTDLDLARFAHGLRGALKAVLRWLASLRRRQANRVDYRRMLRMSDRELNDVGLTRDDIRAALSEPPFWDAPD